MSRIVFSSVFSIHEYVLLRLVALKNFQTILQDAYSMIHDTISTHPDEEGLISTSTCDLAIDIWQEARVFMRQWRNHVLKYPQSLEACFNHFTILHDIFKRQPVLNMTGSDNPQAD